MAAANPTYDWLGQVCSSCKGVLIPPSPLQILLPFSSQVNFNSNECLFSLKFSEVKHLLSGNILVGSGKDSSYLVYSVIIWFVRLIKV